MQGVRRVETGKDIIDLTGLAKTWGTTSSVAVIIASGAKEEKNELF
jgi:hypothetical protein